MRNFVTTFDFKNQEMRLAININAPDGVDITYKMSGWKVWLIITVMILAVVIIIWVICCCVKKHKKNKLAKRYQTLGAGQFEDEITAE